MGADGAGAKAVRVLVAVGLVLAAAATVRMGAPADGLPGVALGSPSMLAIERGLALFVVWLVVLVVLAEAWRGHLPLEVSGRGVRFAVASVSERIVRRADVALERLEAEMAWHRREIDNLRHLSERALGGKVE